MKIKKIVFTLMSIIGLSVILSAGLSAAVPDTINYQGYLTDSSDMPVDATESITFTIYDAASGGTALWSETENVLVTSGTFSNQLGDTVAFPADLFNGQELYVGITVGTDSEMTPRKPVTSAPYAFKSAEADTATQADNAMTLEGKTSAELDQSAHVTDTANPHSVTAAQINAVTLSGLDVHSDDESVHHSRYTNTEAVSAMGVKSDMNALNHDKYADSSAVAAILAADGAGSNLDADLLDGQQVSEIIDAASDEVRTPITQSDLPLTISTPGSYYFAENLTHSSLSSNAIFINGSHITIDMMGFTMTGPGKTSGGTGNGIFINFSQNVTIKNGTIREFGNDAISVGNTAIPGIRVFGIRAYSNGDDGLSLLGFNHQIIDCNAYDNGGIGIMARQGNSVLKNNVVRANGEEGINVGEGSVVVNNASSQNVGDGIVLFGGETVVKGNTVRDNQGSGINHVSGSENLIMDNVVRGNLGAFGITSFSYSSVIKNTVINNSGTGINVHSNSLVKDNIVSANNTSNGASGAGIAAFQKSRIIGNTVGENMQSGIRLTSTENLVEDNYIGNSPVGIQLSVGNAWRDNSFTGNTSDTTGTGTDGGGNISF